MKFAKKLFIFPFLLLTLCLAACEDNETPLPAYVTELAELQTDADGMARRLRQDNGGNLTIINAHDIKPLVADTLYRVQVMYVKGDDEAVTVTDLRSVISPQPRKFKAEEMKRDPLQLDALWRSGRYVNFSISLLTAGNAHTFAFADNGIRRRTDGSHLLRIELYHNQNNDPEHYTRQTILSCPLYEYENVLVKGRDSVEVTVTTHQGRSVTRLPI